jgi:protein subunit release factor A
MLFSIPRTDLDLSFFSAGENEGAKDKTSLACRIVHIPSGAAGESCDELSQPENRALALHRLTSSKRFVAWVKACAAALDEDSATPHTVVYGHSESVSIKSGQK